MPFYEATVQQRFSVTDESIIGEVRRAARQLSQIAGHDATLVGRTGIVATELCTNLWRHAGGGEILLQVLGEQVEILAVDRGPGMDVESALRDGYSTAGSAGQGLGAVRRASSEFDLYSHGQGSVVMSRIGPAARVSFGAICQRLRGETDCGDAWAVAAGDARVSVCVVDGLGHGVLAGEASRTLTRSFAAAPADEPSQQLERGHVRMTGTRGAAAAFASVRGSNALSYSGIGNISGCLISSRQGSQGLVSHSGILGVQTRRVQQFEYSVSPDALLVMHSDGVSARWNLAEQPGLHGRHPAVIAAWLFREHARPRDDATVVVMRP